MSTLNKMMIGFTAGVILGVLYAPAKGEKTRNKLRKVGGGVRDGWDNITDTIAAGIDNIKDKTNSHSATTMEEIQNSQLENPDMIL